MKKLLPILIAPLLAAGMLLSLSCRGKPVPAEPAATPVSETAETSTAAPAPTTTEKPTVSPPPTTVKEPVTTAAPAPVGLTALHKAAGCWNSGDEKRFVCISHTEEGWRFAEGFWYSDDGITGYLTAPVRGDPAGILTVRLFSQGYESELSGMSLPRIDEDIQLDLSDVADGTLRVKLSGQWNTYYYAGETMDDAMPPMQSMRQFPAPPKGWHPEGEPGNTTLSDGDAARLLEKLQGNWHIQNSRYFLMIRKEEDGNYSLGFAFFEGEIDEYGYLQAPFRGSASEMIGARWYYEGYTSADGYVMPAIDEEVYFDLSRLSENWIGWCRGGEWAKCCYAGEDINDVYEYWNSHSTE